MSTRTVRLDEQAEEVLDEMVQRTGLSISEVLREGLFALHRQGGQNEKLPYQIYDELDLGEGGWSVAPSTDSRRGVREALRRKHER